MYLTYQELMVIHEERIQEMLSYARPRSDVKESDIISRIQSMLRNLFQLEYGFAYNLVKKAYKR